jgi:hypothetical protein
MVTRQRRSRPARPYETNWTLPFREASNAAGSGAVTRIGSNIYAAYRSAQTDKNADDYSRSSARRDMPRGWSSRRACRNLRSAGRGRGPNSHAKTSGLCVEQGCGVRRHD